jgi:hypothetical protein
VSRKNVSELMRNVRSGIRRKTAHFPPPHPEAMRFLPKTVRNKILKTDLAEVGLFLLAGWHFPLTFLFAD